MMLFVADDEELRFFMVTEHLGYARPIMEIEQADVGYQVKLKVFSGWTVVAKDSLDGCRRFVRQRLFGVDEP